MKKGRRQDERHSLFNVCSVGRSVKYSLIQCHFWYWTKKQLFNFPLDKIHRTQYVCTLPSLHTLSEIIKNISQLEQIALLIEKPSCHSAFCLFSFHAEQMDWLTHQFRQLIKGSCYKRQMSPDFHFLPYTNTWNYWSKGIHLVIFISTIPKHEIIDQKTYILCIHFQPHS